MQFNKSSSSLLLALISILLFSSCTKRQLDTKDWATTYKSVSTLPYGTYITYNLIDSIFSDEGAFHSRISRTSIDTEIYDLLDYSFFQEEYNEETDEYENIEIELTDHFLTDLYEEKMLDNTYAYIFILTDFRVNEDSESALCDFVGTGNNVFISAETISESMLKRLAVIGSETPILKDSVYTLRDEPQRTFTFPPLSERIMGVSNRQTTHFDIRNITLPFEILATDVNKKPCFIKIKYGFGHFYLHTVPRAFANITMLDLQQYDFGFRCLSYLPKDSHIIWDESLKRNSEFGDEDRGIFDVLFKSPSLTWGFIILILGLLLYMLFRGKRTQRPIPIIEAPKNMSLAFLNTLSNMYSKKKDYIGSMEKRHAFFLDFIRRNYYIETETMDAKFIKTLSAKSTVQEETIRSILGYYEQLQRGNYITSEVFMSYNKYLEKFYRIAKNK